MRYPFGVTTFVELSPDQPPHELGHRHLVLRGERRDPLLIAGG